MIKPKLPFNPKGSSAIWHCAFHIKEYQNDLEVAMIRDNVVEEEEVTMCRFLNELNRDN